MLGGGHVHPLPFPAFTISNSFPILLPRHLASFSLPLVQQWVNKRYQQWSNCEGTRGTAFPFRFWRGNAVPLAYTTSVGVRGERGVPRVHSIIS